MAILVYKLTCTVTDKSYVGITARALDTRWLEHCARARQGVRDSRLYDAMRKYGLDAWAREIVATADTEDEARALERAFIAQLDTYWNGYNANLGGHGALHFTPEQRKKIGDAQRGKVIPADVREKMSAAKRGDKAMAARLGANVEKGAKNPRAHAFIIRLPDGSEEMVRGLRQFCREHGLHYRHIRSKDRQSSKGYTLLRRLGATTNSAANALEMKGE